MDAPSPTPRRHPEVGSIRGTITAMLIAFSCVLIFRAAVVEAFIIPTGSMAPTLLGQHVRLHSPLTGDSWAVGATRERGFEDVRVTDPSTLLRVGAERAPVGAGDRIFVFKTPWAITTPPRWSAVVFKNPENPGENFIKRLVGLPGEEVWLVDGDVFVRDAGGSRWRIARKPERAQRALWWTIYSSERAPRTDDADELRWRSPWILKDVERDEVLDTGGPTFEIPGGGAHTLTWDSSSRPIDDSAAYNDSPALRGGAVFPTGDVRVRFAVRSHGEGLTSSVIIAARSHDFRFDVGVGTALLRMRAHERDDADWDLLGEIEHEGLRAGAWGDASFALVDQTLVARVNGREAFRHELDWSPRERLAHATGLDEDALGALLEDERDTALAQPGLYRRSEARVRVEFRGAPATLARVGLDRDVSFAPAERRSGPLAGEVGMGGHPLRTARLKDDQLFVLGDNAAASRDGRLWDRVHPRVAGSIDRDIGVVALDLLVGRAFMVYFPSPHEVTVAGKRRPLVPDFGRVRLIR